MSAALVVHRLAVGESQTRELREFGGYGFGFVIMSKSSVRKGVTGRPSFE